MNFAKSLLSHLNCEATKRTLSLGLLTFLCISIAYYIVDFNVIRSDVAGYVKWSYDLSGQTFPSHMPGYPALIALGRFVTFKVLNDTLVAQGICLIFWAFGVVVCQKVLRILAPQMEGIGILGYGLAPLVGVSLVAYPVADVVGHSVFLCSVLAALRSKWWLFSLITSIGLLIHQSFYPFYLYLSIVCCLTKGMRWIQLVMSGVPFVIYYVYMAIVKSNPNWILDYHSKTTLASKNGFVAFDGILGELSSFSVTGLVKGSILLSVCLTAVVLTWHFGRRRDWFVTSLLVPMIIYSAASNEAVSFLLIRLAKMMVIPLCIWATEFPKSIRMSQTRIFYWSAAICLICSQFLWGAYTVHFQTK